MGRAGMVAPGRAHTVSVYGHQQPLLTTCTFLMYSSTDHTMNILKWLGKMYSLVVKDIYL